MLYVMHLKDTGLRQVFCLLVFTFKSCLEETTILIEEVLKIKISQGDKHLNKHYKETLKIIRFHLKKKKKKKLEVKIRYVQPCYILSILS